MGDLKELTKTLTDEIAKLKKSENSSLIEKSQVQIQIDKLKNEKEDIRRDIIDIKRKKEDEIEDFYR